MITRPVHESADLVLLDTEAKKILEEAKVRLARAGGDLKIKEAVDNCHESLDKAISAGNCSPEDARTVKREVIREARDRKFELNPSD